MKKMISHAIHAYKEGQLSIDALVGELRRAADDGGRRPLSEGQRGIWALQKLHPGMSAYNIPMCFAVRDLQVEAFRQACRHVVRQYPMLGAAIREAGGEPWRVQADAGIADPVVEALADGVGAEADEAAILAHLRVQALEAFSMEDGPLLRVRLLGLAGWRGAAAGQGRLTPAHTIVSLHVHHVIFDGQSLVALVNALFDAYRDLVRGGLPELLELPETYDDFVAEERAMLAGEEGARRLAYWRQALEGLAPPPELPAQASHPERAADPAGATLAMPLAADVAARVAGFLQQHHLSASAFFLGVFKLMLHRYTGATDIVVGMPVDVRGPQRYRAVMGFFINMLPLRTRLGADEPVLSVLRRLQGTLIDGIAMQYPFSALVRRLGLHGQGEGAPMYRVAFMHQDFLGELRCEDEDIAPLGELRQEGEYELVLEVRESAMARGCKGFALNWKYRTDRHDEASVQAMMRHYATLMDSVLAEAGRSVGDCAMLGADEEALLLSGWSDTQADFPRERRVHELVDDRAAQAPAASAVSCGAVSLSYAQLKADSDRLAARLAGSGIRAGDRVAVRLGRSVDLVVGLLAVLKAGGVYIPLDPDYPDPWTVDILRDCTPRAILAQRATRAQAIALARQAAGAQAAPPLALCADDAEDVAPVAEAPPAQAAPEGAELAYVIYTSGSTGRPKGVMIPHTALTNFLVSMARRPGLRDTDSLLAVTTCCFDIAALELFLPLVQGARCIVCDAATARDGVALRDMIRRLRPTIMQATPSTWELLLHAGWRNEGRLRVLCGGDALSESLKQRLLACSDEVWNMFGPTETTIWSTLARVTADAPVSIGHPIANTRIRIVDASGKLVPAGIPGELCIAGEGLAAGYLNRPEETRARFVEGFEDPSAPGRRERMYKTGDLARWRRDGSIEHLGRIDFQVKIRGHRVEVQNIEHHLGAHPNVRAVAVVARRQAGVDQLVAHYVPRSGLGAAEPAAAGRELSAWLTGRLPDYMVPALFLPIEALPMTGNGKVNRKALVERTVSLRATAGPASKAADAAPARADAAALEARLLALCRDVLKIADMDATDGFFEAGGDSVTLAVIASRAAAEFDEAAVGAGDFFKYPNVRALAAHIAARAGEAPDVPGGASDAIDAGAAGEAAPAQDTPSHRLDDDAVAIIGISCELPGAADHREFWRNLARGHESARFYTEDELRSAGVPEARIRHPHHVPMQQTIAGKDLFDRGFFKLTAKDAQLMDPQFRLLLQHAWKAIEDAGYTRAQVADAGVYMSASNSYYQASLNAAGAVDPADEYQAWLLAQGGTIPTRVSYELGLTGPSLFVHSNCSSGLVSLALAAQALRLGECRHALVGASTVLPSSGIGYVHQPGLNLSSDGHCRTFDANADGLTPGEGVAVLLAKRAVDAIRDGDHVYAVLRGIRINNDGAEKVGFYAPSVGGQSDVIQKVLDATGIDPQTIGYVEAHGTGTKLGDPVEISALTDVYRRYTAKNQYCAIGSVKPNIGHLDTVAGLSGCIKVALSLAQGQIPPSINFETPNAGIDFARSPFYVAERLQPWPEQSRGAPRRAALSSFGIGGTNAHLIMEALEQPVDGAGEDAPRIVPLSARNPERLRAQVAQLQAFLRQEAGSLPPLASIAFTLQLGREAMPSRAAFVVSGHQALQQALAHYLENDAADGRSCFIGHAGAEQDIVKVLSDDDDTGELILAWCESGKLAKVAALWAQGVAVDWRVLYRRSRPARASLPTYPFAPEPCTPPLGATAATIRGLPPAASIAAPTLHPMLHERVSDASPDGMRLRSRFTGGEFFLAEHRIRGRRILPGVAYLEMARVAAERVRAGQLVQVQSVVWTTPLVVEATTHVVLSLGQSQEQGAGGDRARLLPFTVRSSAGAEGGESQLNCQGTIRIVPRADATAPDPVDIAQLLARCPREVPADRFYEYLDSGGGNYGPSFRTITALHKGHREVLARLDLPPAAPRDASLVLHPCMLDAAFQIADSLILQPRANGGCLPFFVKDVVVWRAPGQHAYAHVRLGDDDASGPVTRYDIDLLDADGRVCVSMKEFSARAETADGHAGANTYWARCRGDAAHELPETGGRRPVRRFAAVEPDRWMLDRAAFRPEGVYWIADAANALGASLACHLGQVPGATVVLTDARALEPAMAQRIAAGFAAGARLEFMQAAVASAGAALADAIRSRHGAIAGVLHCAHASGAGTGHDGPLRALDEATRTDLLDFFICVHTHAQAPAPAQPQADPAAADPAILACIDEREAWTKVGIRQGRSAAIFCPDSLPWPAAAPLLRGIASRQILAVVHALHHVLHHAETAMVVAWKPEGRVPEPPALREAPPARADVPRVADASASLDELVARLKAVVSDIIKSAPEEIDEDQNFGEYGLDSLSLTAFSNRLNDGYSLGAQPAGPLNPTTFFERPTLRQMARHMMEAYPDLVRPAAVQAEAVTVEAPAAPTPLPAAWPAPEERAAEARPDDVAIIGMSGRFPGARDIEEFARNLFAGRDSIGEIPAERWDWRAALGDSHAPESSRWGGFIEGMADFDPLFFNISPKEAYQMDPSHRQLLMHAWWAIEDAGYNPTELAGTRTALFAGIAQSGYSELRREAGEGIEGNSFLGIVPSIALNRISHFLDLHGPSEPVETACSSSLVAIHRAVTSIACGDADMALVGGVQTILTPHAHIGFGKAGMLAPDGRCKTFSARADGFVRGEGVGVLFLKRMSAALRDGDAIHGVIKGSAVNHDGRSNTLTAPNPVAQKEVIVRAHARAGMDPRSIGYIETHGTGTKLGDPIEINALKQAFAERLAAQPDGGDAGWSRSCALGAVKTNVGHLELAAGVAGVIKVLLQMRRRRLAPSLHCDELNPYIDLAGSPFHVLAAEADWPRRVDARGRAQPRRAGVSSFGIGGVNAHVVLEEHIEGLAVAPAGTQPVAIVLSAKEPVRLLDAARALLHFVREPASAVRLDDLAYTLQVGREAMPERLGFVAGSVAELEDRLAAFVAAGRAVDGMVAGRVKSSRQARVAAAPALAGMDRLVDIWVEQRKLAALLDAWVKGAEIPWARLHDGQAQARPRRMHLPGYPFARERYWVSEEKTTPVAGKTGAPARGDEAAPRAHWLAPDASAADGQRFHVVLAGDEACLRDHRVHGEAILPGIAHLEMVREAACRAFGATPEAAVVRMTNVGWIRPVRVAGPTRVGVHLRPDAGGHATFGLHVDDARGERLTCSEGALSVVAGAVDERLDLAALQHAFATSRRVDPADWYAAFERIGITYGPSHRGLQSCLVGPAGVLAKVCLPASERDAARRFTLHPGLLDAVLQAAVGLRPAAPAGAPARPPLLPFAMASAEIFRAAGEAAWAWLRPCGATLEGEARAKSSADKVDIDVCDDDGQVSVRIRGLSSRPLTRPRTDAPPAELGPVAAEAPPPAPEADIGLLTRTAIWNPRALAPLAPEQVGVAPGGAGMLVLGGTRAQQDAIRALFPDCATGAPSREGEALSPLDALRHQLTDSAPLTHVVWLAPASPESSGAAGEAILAAQEQGVLQLFRAIKALLAAGHGAKALSWTVVTCQTHATSAIDEVLPAHAGIHGLVGSMAKEYRQWRVRLLDMPAREDWPFAAMFATPFDPDGNALAWRRGRWLARELVAVDRMPEGQGMFKTGGVYVVIGGAGGIGMAWSRWMIEHFQARIVWIGRRPADAAIRARCEALARHGSAPVYLSADACDRASLAEARERIAQLRWDGRAIATSGVVHSAIVLADASLATMDEERFLASWRSKADVSVRIAEVFGADPLDFMLFFSSITSFGKTAGQSNYAAGCAFKDAFATRLGRDLPYPVKVMNWGYWGSVGVVSDAASRERMAQAGFGSIEPEEGMQALDRLLASRFHQVALLRTLRPGIVGQAGSSGEERIQHYPGAGPSRGDAGSSMARLRSALSGCARAWEQRAGEIEVRSPELESLIARALLWAVLPALEAPESVHARHQRWMDETLATLSEAGWIVREGDDAPRGWQATARARALAAQIWPEWERQAGAWHDDDFRRIPMKLAEVCLRALPEILCGRQRATDVMFPGSSMALVEGLYKGNRKADLFNDIVHDVVLAQARLLDRPLAVIEVGAGTGGTTDGLLRKIRERGVAMGEYVYTDLSHAFLLHARQQYAPRAPFLKTQLFNVEKPIGPQGLEPGRHDLAIATNVLHATQDIRQALRNVKATLRAGGLLVLNEISQKSLFSHVTFGLLDGWWLYQDVELRMPGSPGIDQETWRRVLAGRASRRWSSRPRPCTRTGSRSSSPRATVSCGSGAGVAVHRRRSPRPRRGRHPCRLRWQIRCRRQRPPVRRSATGPGRCGPT